MDRFTNSIIKAFRLMMCLKEHIFEMDAIILMDLIGKTMIRYFHSEGNVIFGFLELLHFWVFKLFFSLLFLNKANWFNGNLVPQFVKNVFKPLKLII